MDDFLKELAELQIPYQEKPKFIRLYLGLEKELELVIDPGSYQGFWDPEQFRNDPDFLETLYCLGWLEKDGIPANLEEELSAFCEKYGFKLEGKIQGDGVYVFKIKGLPEPTCSPPKLLQ
ncbi:MAG: hypothetical protein DRP12_01420 [Candidatus Aenigmatarchaeota archaeon]|nr:MAG: hypothetical protein DRP12_01420 [Candidatus Aenigmarchaeota archaeon]